MTRLSFLLGCLVLVACPAKRGDLATDPAHDGGLSAPSDSADDGGVLLTGAKIDAWLQYQKRSMARPDAGALDALARARREHLLRVDAGLDEDELDAIEDLVSAVVTQRNLAKLTGTEAVREFEQAAVALTPTQRAHTQKAMADVKARAHQAASLETERARFGSTAVDAVLEREADVTKTWDALVDGKELR